MKKQLYYVILLIFISFTGCYQQVDSSNLEQVESNEYVYSVSDLSVCEKNEIINTSIFYSSSFSIIDTDDIYELYFENYSKNDNILLSPVRLTPYTKVNEVPTFFVDIKDRKIMVEDNIQKLEINQSYSHMDASSLTECIITVYFYPIVSQKTRNELQLKKVQMNDQIYCDGIYEIRINEVDDPEFDEVRQLP